MTWTWLDMVVTSHQTVALSPHLNMDKKPLSVKPSVYLPMSISSFRLIDFGTVASINSSIDPKPVTFTISATSSSEALLCRKAKLHNKLGYTCMLVAAAADTS